MQEPCSRVTTTSGFPKFRKVLIPISAAALLCAGAAVLAQTPSAVKDGTVYNRPAVLISNDKLEVAIAKQGGSMLRILIQGDQQGLSPYGNPEMAPSVPDNRKFTGSMVGHFVCVDGFGNPSREESAAGLAMHGEAYLQPWKLESSDKQGGTATVKFSAELPLRQESFTRTIRMVDGESVIYVDSELESHTAFDRTANWGEHPFLFPPFIEREHTVVDMSGTRSRTRNYDAPTAAGGGGGRGGRGGQAGPAGAAGRGPQGAPGAPGVPAAPGAPGAPGAVAGPGGAGAPAGMAGRGAAGGGRGLQQDKEFAWPMAPDPDGKPIDMRAAPAVGSWTAHTTTLVDPSRQLGFITIMNTARHYLLGYVFRREEYPWVQNYMQYNSDWMGRGVEFATQPFDLPHRDMEEMNRMYDTPVYRWLPAKSKISTRFLMFWVKSPGRHDPHRRRAVGERQSHRGRPRRGEDHHAGGFIADVVGSALPGCRRPFGRRSGRRAQCRRVTNALFSRYLYAAQTTRLRRACCS